MKHINETIVSFLAAPIKLITSGVSSPMTTQSIDRMAVEIDGQGAPVVLLHGLGGTSNTWTPIMGALSQRRAIRSEWKALSQSNAFAPLYCA
jgi:pimeloyl-ACP methyl ester carboxylesterase